MKIIKQYLTTILLLFAISIYSQEETGAAQAEEQDLENAIQNPIASLITIPIQNNTQFGIGPDKQVQNVTNLQPVIPVGIGENVNLIIRTIIPFISQPLGNGNSEFGLGDTALSLFFTPQKPGKLIWGLGPAIGLPTATDQVLGTGKWSAGPAIIGLIQPKGWTMGFTVQNTWSFAGQSDRGDVNSFYSQVFITKNLNDGWYINSAPIITANWEAANGEEWLVPIGAGAGKLFRVGNLPINAQVGYYNYIVSPTFGPEWQLRAQVNFLFPK